MNSLKNFLKTNKLTRNLYNKLTNKYHIRKIKKQRAYFRAHSLETMNKVQSVFSKTNHKFFFAFGTLLGIVRDKKLLENDMDLDLIVYCKDQEDVSKFKKQMEEEGLYVEFEFCVKDIGVVQHAFIFNKIRIDVHYCFAREEDRFDYVYVLYDGIENLFDVARFECPHSMSSVVDFRELKINVPSDSIEFLLKMYGEDWRIPNSNYRFQDSPCVEVLKGAGYCND